MSEHDLLTENLWKFVRGDTAPAAFEQWICTTPELEQVLGPRLYLQAISASYREHDEVDAVRAEIRTFLVTFRPAACACLEMRDLHVVMMGAHEHLLRTLAVLKKHGKPLWWLGLCRCTECRQHWLVASEERKNDVYCLRRLSESAADEIVSGGRWPTEFHQYETLIRLGIEANIEFVFVNPMDARWTIALLAEQRPGIRVSEIAELASLDVDTATMVARETVLLDGVKITFDA